MVLGKISGSRFVIYLIYALLVTGTLLVVRFPEDKFLQYAAKKVEASFPDTRVKFSNLSYLFPFSAHLDRAEMDSVLPEEEIIPLQDISITPQLAGFGLAYAVTGSLLGGTFTSTVKMVAGNKRYRLEELDLSGLDLSRSAYLARIFRRDIQGTLKFRGDYSGALGGLVKGGAGITCNGVLGLTDGSFALRQPLLTLKNMEFASLDAAVRMEGGVLTLREGTLAGTKLQADFSGVLNAEGSPGSWKLDLEGGIVPSREFLQENPQLVTVVNRLQKQYKKNTLPYSINGTVANPRFRFGRMN